MQQSGLRRFSCQGNPSCCCAASVQVSVAMAMSVLSSAWVDKISMHTEKVSSAVPGLYLLSGLVPGVTCEEPAQVYAATGYAFLRRSWIKADSTGSSMLLGISGKLAFREKTLMERNTFQRMSGETGIPQSFHLSPRQVITIKKHWSETFW